MNVKKELMQLFDLRNEVEQTEKRIQKLQIEIKTYSADIVEGSSQCYPYEKVTFKVYGTDLKIKNKLMFLELRLKERYDRLLEQQLKIEEFIDTIQDSRIRRILQYRYIDRYSWVKVANCIGSMVTADSIRMEHDRFLEKV